MNPPIFGDVTQNVFRGIITSSLTHKLCLNSKVKDHFNILTDFNQFGLCSNKLHHLLYYNIA